MTDITPMWNLSTFDNIKQNKPINRRVSLETLAKSLLIPYGMETQLEKSDLPLWSPTTFGGIRSKKNAQEVSMLVFDMDDGVAPFDSWRCWTEWTVLAHTSFSHKPQHHKYRIILPLAKPIPAQDWSRASVAAVRLWERVVGRGEPDPKAIKDVARIYFRFSIPASEMGGGHPLHPEQYHQRAHHLNGNYLDLDYSDIHIPKPTPIRVNRGGMVRASDAVLDSSVRLDIANRCGAEIQGNVARHVQCPNCGRRAVHWYIEIYEGGQKWPKCNHQNSCGWWGKFEELL